MREKSRKKREFDCSVSPRRVDAREILGLARGGSVLFHVSGPAQKADFLKDLLRLLGVPTDRIRAPE
jgi:hypothetical protein